MKCNFKLTTAIIFAFILCVVAACGDDEGLPFWIEAHDSTINVQGASEDGISLITATIFDDKGNRVEDGDMFFTLNDSARGSFLDADGNRTHTFAVDLEDGVAEAIFHSTLAPETVTVSAYCASYPRDNKVSTTVRVYNSRLKAAFEHTVDEDNGLKVYFYDTSGYPDGTTPSFSWNFGDGSPASSSRGSLSFPQYHVYDEAGTYTVSLTVTVNGSSTASGIIVVEE